VSERKTDFGLSNKNTLRKAKCEGNENRLIGCQGGIWTKMEK